jgi:rhodanese-related sulfurtransferase
MKNYVDLDAQEFLTISKSVFGAVVVDCRTASEIKIRSLKYDLHLDISLKGTYKQIEKLDRKKSYFIYCHSGSRSSFLCEYFAKHDFKNLFNLEGGIQTIK